MLKQFNVFFFLSCCLLLLLYLVDINVLYILSNCIILFCLLDEEQHLFRFWIAKRTRMFYERHTCVLYKYYIELQVRVWWLDDEMEERCVYNYKQFLFRNFCLFVVSIWLMSLLVFLAFFRKEKWGLVSSLSFPSLSKNTYKSFSKKIYESRS